MDRISASERGLVVDEHGVEDVLHCLEVLDDFQSGLDYAYFGASFRAFSFKYVFEFCFVIWNLYMVGYYGFSIEKSLA